jgi:site-specific DNA-methyltransferase (adenine-specific)
MTNTQFKLFVGDCIEKMKDIPDDTIDSIVTDPPYELGFMGKAWDSTGIAYNLEFWQEALRILKPGGYLLSFGGSRTYHRMACAIEDAGFEIRDQIMWVYSSGFPKSHDVSQAIDKELGATRKKIGTKQGTTSVKKGGQYRGGVGVQQTSVAVDITEPATDEARQWDGWGTALKPAHEPIVMARKPLSERNVARNVLEWGTGSININGTRVGTEKMLRHTTTATGAEVGRWPANFIHDGSGEVVDSFPKKTDERFFYCAKANSKERSEGLGDKNFHPTVKPIELMRYLVRMVTPPNGIVLDPFTGSGSTGVGAIKEARRFYGIELNKEYAKIARARLKHATTTILDD